MPLNQHKGQKAFKQNVKTLMGDIGKSPHVQSREQAMAIAYSTARRAAKHKEYGGGIPDFRKREGFSDLTPGRDANQPVLDRPPQKPENPNPHDDPEMPPGNDPRWGTQFQGMQEGGGLGGGPGGQLGGMPGEGAAQTMFQGPLHGTAPGRTDVHNIDVKSGSYVVPADVVSALGEGNTLAGQNVLKLMFKPNALGGQQTPGRKGNYGPGMKDAKGAAEMAKPKMPTNVRGFVRGGAATKPVPIVAAGGEHVIPPEAIEAKFGDLDHGHESLDRFVAHVRKHHIKTLQKLPDPKK